VICEKPLVLNPWNVDALREIEAETGKKSLHHPATAAAPRNHQPEKAGRSRPRR